MSYLVYKHTNKINNKVYIGITSRNANERWGNNGINYKNSSYFYSAIQKYGWDNFNHEILFTGLTKDDACNKEIELIAFYKSSDKAFGYNMTTGGECCHMTEEAKQKLSKALMGNKNGFGKPCSKEKAEKISKAQLGKKVTEETRLKQSIAASKRHVPCSDSKKIKLQNSYPKMKKVYCLETNTIYKSVQECARQLNLQATLVSKVCKGKSLTTGGYHLKYYDDMINA